MGKQILKSARKMLIHANKHHDIMVDAIFCHQKYRSVKLDNVLEGR